MILVCEPLRLERPSLRKPSVRFTGAARPKPLLTPRWLEITQIKEHWLKEEQILGLYSMEDVPIEDSPEQARLLWPWEQIPLLFPSMEGGEPESDPDKSSIL